MLRCKFYDIISSFKPAQNIASFLPKWNETSDAFVSNGYAPRTESSLNLVRGCCCCIRVQCLQSILPNVPRKKIFLTESDQLNEMKNGKMARGPTPDILFVRPIRINGRLVKWIDAKLYYASMTFANHKKLPNGKLRKMAQRYNTYFGGEGAFVFGQSYCAGLSQVVTEAMLLDHSPLDLSAVNEFQDNS